MLILWGGGGEICLLALTNSSIDKSANILNQYHERLNSSGNIEKSTVLEAIASLNPIIFIDEPHLLKGDKFSQSFGKFSSLYFRFGATFPSQNEHKLSNLIYCLDSVSAFKNYLVKQIHVHTILQDSQAPNLMQINARQKSARFSYFVDNIEYQKDVKIDEDLGQKLNYGKLNGVTINNLNSKKLFLSSGDTLEPTRGYRLDEAQIKELISKAIDLHFEKEIRLFKEGIKALSLFFIPNIADFVGENASIRLEFNKLFIKKRDEILKRDDLSDEYRAFLSRDFDKNGELKVAHGYFSSSRGSKDEQEALGVKLILGEKEKLLSLNEPLRFIFSVWALQEGWDNPNVFTIVKLASTAKDESRHQQVGRGLRLCLNQNGVRMSYEHLKGDDEKFYEINSLDVLVNGAESGFIQALQSEIIKSSISFNDEFINSEILKQNGLNEREANRLTSHLEDAKALAYSEENDHYIIKIPLYEFLSNDKKSKEILGDKFDSFLQAIKPSANKNAQIKNANKKEGQIPIKKELAAKFKTLIEALQQKSKIYYDKFDDNALINVVASEFDKLNIEPVKIKIKKELYNSQTGSIEVKDISELSGGKMAKFSTKNLLNFAKDSGLTLNFVLEIYNKISQKAYFANNAKLALKELERIIKEHIHQNIINAVNYKFVQTTITNEAPFSLLFDEKGSPKPSIAWDKLGRFISDKTPAKNYLYEKAVYDSKIEEELMLNETKALQDKTSISVFAKLPKFSIPTPYKNYEPDFAYLLEDKEGKTIFFICESKGYDNESDIPPNEQKKISYARRFFEQLQAHLPNIQIKFNTRINKEDLIDALNKESKC